MATEESDVTTTEAETAATTETVQQLQYLGFVRSFVTLLFSSALKLYDFLEQRSGPLKNLIDVIEKAESAVIGPAVSKFANLGDDVLIFIDDRLVKAVELYEEVVPESLQSAITEFTTMLKSAITESINLSEGVAKVCTKLVEKFKEGGMKGVISYMVLYIYQLLATLYAKLLQIMVSKVTEMLLRAIKIPSVQSLITTAVPLATAAIDKYSQGLTNALEAVSTAATASTSLASSATSAAEDVAADVTDVAETVTSVTTAVVCGATDTLTEVAAALKG